MTTQTDLLQMPIAQLPLSSELKESLTHNGYTNLQHLLQQKLSHLRTQNGLTIHDELELFDMVNEKGLANLWREE